MQTLVFTGARNGTVERFDMRMAKQHSTKLFDARFGAVPRSSVVHLALLRDHEMLLSHLNGDVRAPLAPYAITHQPKIPAARHLRHALPLRIPAKGIRGPRQPRHP